MGWIESMFGVRNMQQQEEAVARTTPPSEVVVASPPPPKPLYLWRCLVGVRLWVLTPGTSQEDARQRVAAFLNTQRRHKAVGCSSVLPELGSPNVGPKFVYYI